MNGIAAVGEALEAVTTPVAQATQSVISEVASPLAAAEKAAGNIASSVRSITPDAVPGAVAPNVSLFSQTMGHHQALEALIDQFLLLLKKEILQI